MFVAVKTEDRNQTESFRAGKILNLNKQNILLAGIFVHRYRTITAEDVYGSKYVPAFHDELAKKKKAWRDKIFGGDCHCKFLIINRAGKATCSST